ncbi:protein-disulfide reductase DsbD [Pasteurellaceae bacterium Pebbles2]|nr:protein-disulfide reductase DsbD [Pasteurellaceae bacterium Pebbles2]
MKKLFTFFILLLSAFSAQAGLFDSKPRFLKADQAFQFSAQAKGDNVELHWSIADDYYLYKKEIAVSAENAKVGELQFPTAELHEDEFFGKVEIFRGDLNVPVPLLERAKSTKLVVSYQGCTKGFCYPPEEKVVDLSALGVGDQNVAQESNQTAAQNSEVSETLENNTAVSAPANLSEQDQLAQSLFQSKYAVFWFFLLGVGLAFTPCVLPMLPLLSAIVIGQGERPKLGRALGLSFVYVQGMALTYTLLGLIVAAIGLPFQIALQSPPVLIVLSVLFILLSGSMFGLYNLQLPASLQTKLAQLSQKQKSGAFGGVFVMGMLAGLVASPCTSAPLSGALLYVAQSGDLFTGGITLYLLALGMGVPLMLITVFGNQVLPKSGEWLNVVKELFGFILLLLPVFLLERVFGEWSSTLWAVWFIAFVCWIASKRFWVGFVTALAIYFALYQFDLFGLNHDKNSQSAVQNLSISTPHFQRVNSVDELKQALAQNSKSIAMLDLYADWCVACKEFEKYTFSDAQVQQDFENVLLLQVDMTKNSPANSELMKHLDVLGLPTIVFFDKNGNEIQGSRVTGFMPATEFHQWLTQFLP